MSLVDYSNPEYPSAIFAVHTGPVKDSGAIWLYEANWCKFTQSDELLQRTAAPGYLSKSLKEENRVVPFSDIQHNERMKALVEYTSSSLETEFPSPFGSAIYDSRTEALLSQAYDNVLQERDPTNHAEINAIRQATRQLQRLSLSGCILYSTCEPCPMCMSACIWAELDAVVFGASTMEDANSYWPQVSHLSPTEIVSRMCREPKCILIPHVERERCRDLFKKCDEARRIKCLELPPHREIS